MRSLVITPNHAITLTPTPTLTLTRCCTWTQRCPYSTRPPRPVSYLAAGTATCYITASNPNPNPNPNPNSNPHPHPHPHPHPRRDQVLPGRVVRNTPARRANTAPGRANTALCFWDFCAAHSDYDLRLSPASGLHGQPLVPGPLTPGPLTPGALAAVAAPTRLSTPTSLTMAREYTFACWVRLAPTGTAPLRCVAR